MKEKVSLSRRSITLINTQLIHQFILIIVRLKSKNESEKAEVNKNINEYL